MTPWNVPSRPGLAALQAGLDHVRDSPSDDDVVEAIVRRPAVDEREALAVATAPDFALALSGALAVDGWTA